MKKNCFTYKEILKNGGSRANGANNSEKQQDQANIAKKALEESCDVLSVNPSRGKGSQMHGCLIRSAHTTCAQRMSGLAHMSLLKEAKS